MRVHREVKVILHTIWIIKLIMNAHRFTDERLTTQEFVAMKNQLPWGQLPVLSVEDVVLGQSIAQAR